MRISDWSSDVCSSDLAGSRRAGAAAARVSAGRGAGAAGVGVPRVGRRARAAVRLRADDRLGSQRSAAAAPGAAELPRQRGALHSAWRHFARRAPRRRRAADRRSEEHTSELQSLMRISDAVFCLKKINKTTIECAILVAKKNITTNGIT